MATAPVCLQSVVAEHIGLLEPLDAKDGPLARERTVAHLVVWQEFFIRTVHSPLSHPSRFSP